MNNDMEKYLSRFKLSEPATELRRLVLDKAMVHCKQQQESELSATFVLGIKIFFSTAAAILIAVIVLNAVFSTQKEIKFSKYQNEIEMLIELGIPRKSATIIIAIGKGNPAGKVTERNIIAKEDCS